MERQSADSRAAMLHRTGTILMYVGLAVAVGSLLFIDRWPLVGGIVFATALSDVAAGAILKKKNCPRCRKGGCDAN
jgi:hypothetical protein